MSLKYMSLCHSVFLSHSVCQSFSLLVNYKGTNCVRINGFLVCKRCPLRCLLTPFWSPIKHLLLYYFITVWFPCGYKPAFTMFFAVIYWCFLWDNVMFFLTLICRFSMCLKMKRMGLQDVGVIRFATCV